MAEFRGHSWVVRRWSSGLSAIEKETVNTFALPEIIRRHLNKTLSNGLLPWRTPLMKAELPRLSARMGREDTLHWITLLTLASTSHDRAYREANWITLMQAREHGARVRRGQTASSAWFTRKDGRLRYLPVFNVEQCEGVSASMLRLLTPIVPWPTAGVEIPESLSTAPTRTAVESIVDGNGRSIADTSTASPSNFGTKKGLWRSCYEMAIITSHGEKADRTKPSSSTTASPNTDEDEGIIAEMVCRSVWRSHRMRVENDRDERVESKVWLERSRKDPELILSLVERAGMLSEQIMKRTHSVEMPPP
jgi:hypothetical protein